MAFAGDLGSSVFRQHGDSGYFFSVIVIQIVIALLTVIVIVFVIVIVIVIQHVSARVQSRG